MSARITTIVPRIALPASTGIVAVMMAAVVVTVMMVRTVGMAAIQNRAMAGTIPLPPPAGTTEDRQESPSQRGADADAGK